MFFSFSDGGCINNGKKNAIASYCSILIDGKTRETIKGRVQPYKYILNIDHPISDSETLSDFISIDESIKIIPSNNRGELLGIIYCFAQLYLRESESNKETNIEIYSDSLLCINTFNTWLPNRRKNNTAHELKNFDLLLIGEELLNAIKEKYKSIKLLHVKSHQQKPLESEGKKKLFIWMGNQFVDQECTKLLNCN